MEYIILRERKYTEREHILVLPNKTTPQANRGKTVGPGLARIRPLHLGFVACPRSYEIITLHNQSFFLKANQEVVKANKQSPF